MKLLLLGGTGEARAIAKKLAGMGIEAVASLAGVTRAPKPLAIPVRIGGFGGEEGFRDFIEEAGIGAVLDATHPFAARISWRSARLCREMGLPYCQVVRPAWQPDEADNWIDLADEIQAAEHVPESATVFLATGRQSAARFAGLRGRRVICRVVDVQDAPFPFDGGEYLVMRPPYRFDDEVALFKRLGVDWLIAKNAGGEGARAKLDAARHLGLGVGMIQRPAQPDAENVSTVEQALAWVRGLK